LFLFGNSQFGLARWVGNLNFSTIYQQILEEKGLMLLPGSVFEIEDSYFRLGLGRLSFPLALEKLEEWIKTKNLLDFSS